MYSVLLRVSDTNECSSKIKTFKDLIFVTPSNKELKKLVYGHKNKGAQKSGFKSNIPV